MKTLRDASIGSDVVVKKLHGEGAVKRRIMDMGITKGASVHIRKVAPLGDPVEVTVRGYELSLRKEDAEKISTRSPAPTSTLVTGPESRSRKKKENSKITAMSPSRTFPASTPSLRIHWKRSLPETTCWVNILMPS